MSLFLADGAPGMSCVTTPRLAAVVVRSRTRSRVLPGARERVLSLNPSNLAALDARIAFVIRDSGLPQGSHCGAPRIPSFSPLAEPIIHDLPTDSGSARPLRRDGLCAEGASRCTRPAKMRWGSDAVRLTSCRRSPRDGN